MILKNIIYEALSEKMVVNRVSSKEYAKCVANAYEDAPVYDKSAEPYWKALADSNDKLFKRLLSKVDVIFTSEHPKRDKLKLLGKDYKLIQHKDPYSSAKQMADDVKKNGRIMISADHSDHPIFSVEQNIIFRTVHDYIVHILGKKEFGLYGELQSYNLHAKMLPVKARPAAFTEIVGQVCWYDVFGGFPVQKVAILEGFDYVNVGYVSDEAKQKYCNEK